MLGMKHRLESLNPTDIFVAILFLSERLEFFALLITINRKKENSHMLFMQLLLHVVQD